MRNWRGFGGLTALALLATASAARADRVPSSRVPSPPPATGTRPDIMVPYTTNGYSTLGAWHMVGPKIYSSPVVDDVRSPGSKPVFNLPFWGGVMDFGDRSNGAMQRPPGGFPLGAPQR